MHRLIQLPERYHIRHKVLRKREIRIVRAIANDDIILCDVQQEILIMVFRGSDPEYSTNLICKTAVPFDL